MVESTTIARQGAITEHGDDSVDLARRHRESLFPSVALFYDEPIQLRR